MKSYEALPFLNNVGITLLERQQFKESVETFADAVNLHRSNVAQQRGSGTLDKCNEAQTHDANLTQEMLRRASKRLARAPVKSFDDLAHVSMDPFIVLDVANATCMPSILKFGSAIDQIDFAVRMNQEAENQYVSGIRKMNLDSAILFLNYGVACKRASCTYDLCSDDMRNKLHDQSIKLFDLSNKVVQHEIDSLYSAIKSRAEDILVVEQYLEIALMILMFTLAHISDCMYWRHSLEEGVTHYSNFDESLRSFRTLSEKLTSVSKQHAASA